MYTVYYIKSLAFNCVLYVGCTNNWSRRFSNHHFELKFQKHGNSYLQRHVDFLGLDDLRFIHIKDHSDKTVAFELEALFIEHMRPIYNIHHPQFGAATGRKNLTMI